MSASNNWLYHLAHDTRIWRS